MAIDKSKDQGQGLQKDKDDSGKFEKGKKSESEQVSPGTKWDKDKQRFVKEAENKDE